MFMYFKVCHIFTGGGSQLLSDYSRSNLVFKMVCTTNFQTFEVSASHQPPCLHGDGACQPIINKPVELSVTDKRLTVIKE